MIKQAQALGPSDPRYRNSIGTYTVKYQVRENTSGNPVKGYMVGNNPKDPNKAEKDADIFVSKFGNNHSKRHCRTQKNTHHAEHITWT